MIVLRQFKFQGGTWKSLGLTLALELNTYFRLLIFVPTVFGNWGSHVNMTNPFAKSYICTNSTSTFLFQ